MKTAIKPPLVIDKSFAHSRTHLLSKLAKDYTLLMPSAFFYEVFTTVPEKRALELKDFPPFQRVHIGTLLKQERKTGKPADSINFREMNFNPMVASASWRLSADNAKIVEKDKVASVGPALDFWQDVLKLRCVPGFSEDELGSTRGSDEEFIHLCEKLREEYRIQEIAKEFAWIHAPKLNPHWLYYRHLQTLVLQGLVLLRRYPNPGDVFGILRTEHDVHDLEYLTLGLHAGSLATAEISTLLSKASMSWRFRMLHPRGNLVEPMAKPGRTTEHIANSQKN